MEINEVKIDEIIKEIIEWTRTFSFEEKIPAELFVDIKTLKLDFLMDPKNQLINTEYGEDKRRIVNKVLIRILDRALESKELRWYDIQGILTKIKEDQVDIEDFYTEDLFERRERQNKEKKKSREKPDSKLEKFSGKRSTTQKELSDKGNNYRVRLEGVVWARSKEEAFKIAREQSDFLVEKSAVLAHRLWNERPSKTDLEDDFESFYHIFLTDEKYDNIDPKNTKLLFKDYDKDVFIVKCLLKNTLERVGVLKFSKTREQFSNPNYVQKKVQFVEIQKDMVDYIVARWIKG